MTAAILVVEHEPRYSERMKEALKARPVELHFARDGDEALQVLDQKHPRLVILSSVIPRISTADLIRQIKARPSGAATPILISVSGYTGKNPKGDAMRLGADDIVPKPFHDHEFAEKVDHLIALHSGPKLTSNQIFGELLEDKQPSARPHRRTTEEDVNKLLEQTLTGMKIPNFAKKKAEADAAAPAGPRPRAASGLDRHVEDTLSGLEKSLKHKTSPGVASAMAAESSPEKVMMSSPVVVPDAAPVREYAEEEGGNRFGQYTLVERIARGGMAEVWKASMRGAEGFEKVVAIKKILPHLSEDSEFVTMFIDEAKLAAQLNHNNIIHIYDLAKVSSAYYIAMEYVEGHDLKDILKQSEERRQTVPVELAMFISSKVAAALDYAHRKRDAAQKELGIVHRDVSPQNVLISNEGDIKLCDFGIAKAASKVTHTQAGALKGKLHYMSPEQAWGKSIDRRSDVFALATVLFEMLTGRRLFSGENEISVLEQVREAKVKAPSTINEDVPPEVDRIVLKALQREPEARYQSAGEMARDIDTVLYSFRPTPTSADLAIYLDRVYAEEQPVFAAAQPEPVTPIPPPPPEPPRHVSAAHVPAAAPHPPARHTDPRMFAASTPAPGKKRLAPLIAAGVLLAVVAGGAVYVLSTRDTETPPVQAAAATPAPAPALAPPETGTLVPFDSSEGQPAPVQEIVPVVPDTAGDQALIDEEVRRRVAAERVRIDQQRSDQIAAQERAAAQERERQLALTREREAAAARTETVTPPLVEEPQPVIESPTVAAAPVTQPQPPAVETVAPVVPTREGDLVAAGTPGLVEPELITFKKVGYPPLARLQKVSGVVVVSVLVNESGRVVDAKVLRGVSKNVGLNEAALEMIRGATFRPGTKDGVRVKSYKTIVVPFKL